VGCPNCESLPLGVICGRCAALRTPRGRAAAKRRETVGRQQRALRRGRRGGGVPVAGEGPNTVRVRLRCAKAHVWWSTMDRDAEEDPVRDPICDCGLYFESVKTLTGRYVAGKRCRKGCWEAKGGVCECECAGAHHGIGEARARAMLAAASAEGRDVA